MASKRVLVTGAAGFIGSHLVAKLVDDGATVVGVDGLEPSYGGNLAHERLVRIQQLGSRLTFITGDILDVDIQQRIADLAPYDAFYHLAAWPGVRGGELLPSEYLRNNIEALCVALRIANDTNARRFIFASSSSVYGNAALSGPCREDQVQAGQQLSLYASTKYLGEEIVRAYVSRTFMSALCARFFTVVGPIGRPDMAYAKFARAMMRGEAVPIYGDGSALRDYTSISDTVWGLVRLADLNLDDHVRSGETLPINIGFSSAYTTMELADSIAAVLGISNPRYESLPQPSVDAQATLADSSRFREICGQREPESLMVMVGRALQDPSWVLE